MPSAVIAYNSVAHYLLVQTNIVWITGLFL